MPNIKLDTSTTFLGGGLLHELQGFFIIHVTNLIPIAIRS